jgi:ParB family chromosome partitioning protein
VYSENDLIPIYQIKLSKFRPPFAEFPKQMPSDVEIETAIDTGFSSPLVVRKVRSLPNKEYELIQGERSWILAQQARLSDCVCEIVTWDDETVKKVLLEDLKSGSGASATNIRNPIDEAKQISLEVKKSGSLYKYAKERGVNRGHIHHKLKLLRLALPVQDMLASGKLSPTHVRDLQRIQPEFRQLDLAQKIANLRLSVPQAQSLIKKNLSQTRFEEATEAEVLLNKIALETSEIINQPIKITAPTKKKPGRIIIDYFSNDEISAVLTRLGYKADF